LVVSKQLNRNAVGIEIDPNNVRCINERINIIKSSDDIKKYYTYYLNTENLNRIWSIENAALKSVNKKEKIISLFEV